MNEQLRKLVEQAGAPPDLLNEIWFHIFCQKFAHLLRAEMEDDFK